LQAQVETFHPGYTCILSAIEELDETVEQDVFIRHTGRWLNSEVELFHAGVLQYGWGEWAKIADYIQTRDRIQVCKFSLNQRAKKVSYRINFSLKVPKQLFRFFQTWLKG
jgi:hypothetical protein